MEILGFVLENILNFDIFEGKFLFSQFLFLRLSLFCLSLLNHKTFHMVYFHFLFCLV